jgi:hypothetical protein
MAMFGIVESLAATLCSTLRNRRDLALENLALRQQVAILRRQVRRPTLTLADRLFWVGLMRTWDGWKDSLILVQPETVIRWFREGFKRYWTRRSRRLVVARALTPNCARWFGRWRWPTHFGAPPASTANSSVLASRCPSAPCRG